jgi:hypothetical protein
MGAVLMTACKPSVPRQYIQPGEMEDILYDYYVSQGMVDVTTSGDNDRDFQRELYFATVLKKYGRTRAEFDSSMVYYYTRADRFRKIYKSVQERLSEDALTLGASEGEVERYLTSQDMTGDTASIWEGDRFVMLVPSLPGNKVQYVQRADTAFRKGDSFLLTFQSDFLIQGGAKDGVACIAVKYSNDSICSTVTHFSMNGVNQIRINPCDEKVKTITTFFYMGDGADKSPNLKLLILSRIQLIRFHQKKNEVKTVESAAVERPDTVRPMPDSLRPRHHRLGEIPVDNKHVKPITQKE